MLRDYQNECYSAIHDGWETENRVLAVLPTGTGKTEIFVRVADDRDGRSLVICPTIQLVDQAADKIRVRTGKRVSVEQAERSSDERVPFRDKFVVASKQSLWPHRFRRLRDISTVVVDEAHLSATDQYRVILDHFEKQGAKILGMTATPRRLDQRALGVIYGDCCYTFSIKQAIEGGWLVPPKVRSIVIKDLDLSLVGTHGGDFSQTQLSKILEKEGMVCEVADITAREYKAGEPTVVYCSSVEQARRVAHRLEDTHGLAAEWICADKQLCKMHKRRKVLSLLPEGRSIVCNVGILTLGWDCPELKHIVMARPTQSLTLYTQVMGRGTRPLTGTVGVNGTPEGRREAVRLSDKPHYRVTDLRDNAVRHRLVSPQDVLSGDMDWPGRDLILKRMEEGQDVTEDMLEQAQDDHLAQHFRERRRVAKIRAKFQTTEIEVDPFNGVRAKIKPKKTNATIPFGQFKGNKVSEVPSHYLRWLSNTNKTEWLRNAAKAELTSRQNRKGVKDAMHGGE